MIDPEEQKRIFEVYKFSGLNKGDFAKKIGISSTFLSDILNNKKGAGLSVFQGIIFAFENICPRWLLVGKGEMIELCNDHKRFINNMAGEPFVEYKCERCNYYEMLIAEKNALIKTQSDLIYIYQNNPDLDRPHQKKKRESG